MRFLLLYTTLSFSLVSFGQIVDDSTFNVYGPTSTRFLTEERLINNDCLYTTVDTSIYLLERFSPVDISQRRYQDLGVLGSALFPIFYAPPERIGRTSGYTAYQPYAFKPTDIKYFDTKSPYLELFVMLGGGNRNIIDVGFSRNVNKNWNVGFDLRKLTIDKQLAASGQGDRLVEGSSFVAYSHYKHEKWPYQALIHYSLLNHNAIEQGGVRYPSETNPQIADLFDFDNALLRLDEAQTNIKERRVRLYHDYQLSDQFQVYHLVDRRTERNVFKDFTEGTTTGYDSYADFYPDFLIDEDSTYQRARFSSFTNEAGIKGDLASVFYRAYVKVRAVDFTYNYLDPNFGKLERYIGGYARFRWRDQFSIRANAEYLDGGEYLLDGQIKSNFIEASYRTSRTRVPFIYQRYFGNHHEWNNNFESVFTNELKGQLNLDWKGIELAPMANLTTYQNFLYFDAARQPQQISNALLLTRIGANFNVRLLNQKGYGWHFENEAMYSTVTGGGASALRIPKIFYNGRYFWRGNCFKDKVPFELGLDMHARSAYFASAYAPEIQQFYLQDEFEINDYFWTDLFVNMRLDRFFLSFKWTHLNQPDEGGYFASPYYPGQPRVIDLTFRWLFFD